MLRVDSHCHFWSIERGDYGWLSKQNVEVRPIVRDFGHDDIAPLLTAANVQKIVLVQAAASEPETEYLLSIADRHDDVAGVVGWIDLTREDATETLERFSTNAKFKGIRPMLQDIDNTDWLLQAPRSELWAVLANKRMCFDALVQPRHLSMLTAFCETHTDIPIVIDHAAKPKSALEGSLPDFEKWRQDMAQLAEHPHVYCKLSGLLTEFPAELLPKAKQVLKPYVSTLLSLFGSERLMWGSDWPVLTLASNYAAWDQLTAELLHELDSTELSNVLGGTADRFYSLGLAA